MLATEALDRLWLSMALALLFCGYGLDRKLAPVESLPGLTIETLVLALPAVTLIGWQASQGGGFALAA